MSLDQLINFEFSGSLWLLLRAFLLLGLFIYLIFSSVVIRQINQMTNTLEVGFEGPIRFLGWIHLFLALGTFVVAFVIL